MANNNTNPEDQAAIDESLDLLSKYKEIPAYNVADKLGLITAAKHLKDLQEWEVSVLNQALFDIGANTYNAAAVPMNLVGQFFGYNPGFSGERFMQDLNWETGIASLGDRPQPRGDVDRPWGMEAPLVPFKEQPLGEATRAIIDKNIPAPVTESPSIATTVSDTSMAVISYAFDDIDPEVKDLFDKILSSDQDVINTYFSNMIPEQRDAILEYSNSLKERQLAEENKRTDASNL